MPRHLLFAWLVLSLCLVRVGSAEAAVPSEELLPSTTAAYLSVPDVDTLRSRWNETELGKMFDDPIMKPFMDDLGEQLRSKFSRTGVKLGITWDDLEGVYSGEVAVAAVQPDNDPKLHALVLLVDITGKEAEAADLLKKVTKSQTDKGGKVTPRKVDGVDVTEILLAKDVKALGDRAYYAISQKQLVAADNLAVLTHVLDRLKKAGPNTLSAVPAYAVSMKNVAAAAGDTKPHARWFIDPFRYAEVNRAINAARRKRGTDTLKVLRNQGFDAVKGAGGHITLSDGSHDVLHRTFIYAPADKKAKAGDKYRLGARMLDFLDHPTAPPPAWVPSDVATFASLNWNMPAALGKHLGSVVDEFAGDEIFEEVLDSIKTDPNGPMVDLRNDLIKHLGQRLMVISDAVEPIDTKSERLMVAIELEDPKSVEATINKAMSKDPDARKREHNGQIIWEIVSEEEAKFEFEEVKIDGVGFEAVGAAEPVALEEEEEEAKVLPNSAIAVAHGHLIVASHVDFIVRALEGSPDKLAATKDFERVNLALDDLGAGKQALRHFVRTDKAYRTTYELLRNNKMPEGETLLARTLNRLLADEDADEGDLRKQEIDGSKMPDYSEVRKYFGPAGFYGTTQEDGWMITGCLLKK